MKLSDYVAQFLVDQGIEHVFGVTGGAAVHLFDSVEKNPGIEPIFNHHEQASALAAQAYARVRNGLGAAYFTTGPGGTNAITGVTAAWLDSIPVIYISGQTRLAHTTDGRTIRQYGNQQLNIISLVEPITKYAAMVTDPQSILYHLEKALFLETSGRPGPVWLDIPLDIQWADIEPMTLPGFAHEKKGRNSSVVKQSAAAVRQMLKEARRPLVLAGYGIRLSKAEEEFTKLIQSLKLPVVTSWNASDLMAGNDPLNIGRPGIFGQRGANLAVQNCDLLLSIGSHLSVPLTGAQFKEFAPAAKKVVVDIDKAELDHQTVHIDLAVEADAKTFLRDLQDVVPKTPLAIEAWQAQCYRYKQRYNTVPRQWYQEQKFVNPYVFVDVLSEELEKTDVIAVDGGGTTNQIVFQALRLREGQRATISAGVCSMGTGLPESIGLSFGNGKGRVICLCGDGSIQFNVQELQTVVHYNLPIKLFIFNNEGYLSIRQTQDGFLDSKYIGSEAKGGLSLPDIKKVATAYGLQVEQMAGHNTLREQIRRVLEADGPVLCEVLEDPKQEIIPRLGFDRHADGTGTPRSLEDMYPYLDREELAENMVRDQSNKVVQ